MKLDPEDTRFIKKLQFAISDAIQAKSEYTMNVVFHKKRGSVAHPTYSYQVTIDNVGLTEKLKARMKSFLFYVYSLLL